MSPEIAAVSFPFAAADLVALPPKSVTTARLSRSRALAAAHHFSHTANTSRLKKCTRSGHRPKLGTRSSRCRFDITDATLLAGRRGCPLAFVCVDMARRDSDGMCTEMCGLVRAHLAYRHRQS